MTSTAFPWFSARWCWRTKSELLDDRRDYGEVRMTAYEMVQDRLYACTYTIRESCIRLISVRKANAREQKRWLL